MADRPRDDDWWLASDGKWYPPDLESKAEALESRAERYDPSRVSRPFTTAVAIVLSVACAVLVAAAYAGLRYASALQKYTGQLPEFENGPLASVELVWASWTALGILMMVLTGVLVIGWTHSTSKALDNRGPIGRRWRGGWTIGAWLIPFANLVIPKIMFNEIEKIAQVPYGSVPVGEEWRVYSRSQLSDLWWLLWVGGAIPSQVTQFAIGDPANEAGRLAILVTISSFTYALFAGAGIALVFLVRRIERSSRG